MKAFAPFTGLALLILSAPAWAEEAGESAADIGFPQLRQVDTFAGQVFWLAVAFLVLFALMSKLALPRVESVLDERKKQRHDDLAEAERANDEANSVRASFEASLAKAQETAQAQITAVEQDVAEKIAAEISKAGESARKRVASAEQAIAKARQEAVGSLADISAEIAADMAGKIAGLQVSKAEAKQAVASVMKG